MYRVEDTHWWYQGMAEITTHLLDVWCPGSRNLKILDAGCGTGAAARSILAAYGQVTGFDLSSYALACCHQRQLVHLAQATVCAVPFPSSYFDLVTSFDVLCNASIPDVTVAISELYRVLRPGGKLFMRLPAHDWLKGVHDKAVNTVRRFSRRQTATLLEQSGFEVRHTAYANCLLLPLVFLKRKSEALFTPRHVHSDLSTELGVRNDILRKILSLEAPCVARSTFPAGVSLFVLGEKQEGPGPH